MKKILVGAIVTLAILIMAASVFDITFTAPENAIVAVDNQNHVYYAPIPDCLYGLNRAGSFNYMSLLEAEKIAVRDKNCNNKSAFLHDRKIIFVLLDTYIFKEGSDNRWNKDGSWNW